MCVYAEIKPYYHTLLRFGQATDERSFGLGRVDLLPKPHIPAKLAELLPLLLGDVGF